MSYLDELSRELGAVGIRGRRRARILDEFGDHLGCDPQAELGDPRELAGQFADELGTELARNAALIAFATLALVGSTVIARLAMYLPLSSTSLSAADTAALMVSLVCAQLAFVAGGLGLVRAVRLRDHPTIPAAEARILRRRAAVGLLAGVIASGALPFHTSSDRHLIQGDWMGYVAIALTVVASTLAVWPVVAAGRVTPTADGSAGDVFDDLARSLVWRPRWPAGRSRGSPGSSPPHLSWRSRAPDSQPTTALTESSGASPRALDSSSAMRRSAATSDCAAPDRVEDGRVRSRGVGRARR